jgi:hypothetical protein
LHYAARQKKPARPTCLPPPARTLSTLPTQAQILRMTRSQLVECSHEHGIELDAGYNLVLNLRRELLAYVLKKTPRRVKMRSTLPPGMKMG